VEDADGAPVFLHRWLRRQTRAPDGAMAEERSLEMLYRRQRELAMGHGASAHAQLAPGRSDRAVRVCTRIVPEYDLPATVMPDPSEMPELRELSLDMRDLADMETSALLDNLDLLAAAYGGWIERQRARLDDPAEGLQSYRAEAEAALSACEDANSRIAVGVGLLRTDEQALDAFRFMNRAMWRHMNVATRCWMRITPTIGIRCILRRARFTKPLATSLRF